MKLKSGEVILFCVNYNSYDKVAEYLQSLDNAALQAACNVTVIVADNSDPVEKLEFIPEKIQVHHVVTHQNLGYLGGVTYAIRERNIDLSQYDYIIISNVDVFVCDEFFCQLSDADISDDVGCIAPSIYSLAMCYDRNPQRIRRIPKLRLWLLRVMYTFPILYTIHLKFFSSRKYENHTYEKMEIYSPHGSFMIFTKKFAPFLQTFVFPVFLFGEELYFAENLRICGLSVIYDPSIKVKDYDHVNTGQLKNSVRMKWNREALKMIYLKYYK